MRALTLVVLLCASGWAAGCGSDNVGGDDAGKSASSSPAPTPDKPDAQLTPGTRKLEITSAVPIRVDFGDQVKVSGRLLDARNKPVKNAIVSFALVGRAQDSSIASLDSVTDDKGAFENKLIAGDIATAFRLRVASAGAIDLFIDVALSDAGFGTLLVTAAYQGKRLVSQRAVFAQADTACSHAQRAPGDPEATFSASEELASLPALPAATRYAVTAVAANDSGTVLAQGCIDGVAITADTVAKIEIVFTDEPLVRTGHFALAAELEAKAPASALAITLLGSAESLIVGDALDNSTADNPEASFLLDTLDSTLRSNDGQPEWPALADAVAQDRADKPSKETPDHQLQGLLDINDQGPLLAIARMAALTQADLEHLRVTGDFALTPSGSPAATFRPLRIEALASEGGQQPMAVDLALQETAATTQASFLGKEDALRLSSASFRPQLGALSSQALAAVMSVDAPGHGDEIRDLIGCASLDEWLGNQSYSAGASCDADCIAEVCERAVARLFSAAESGLAALDKARPSWTLSGTFALIDKDGDLLTEQMTCEAVDGQWAAEAGSGVQAATLTGTASANLIAP